ncbi:MAG TPA: glycosyltransferase family 9 protein [Burkholderiaceae bacterium]|nr:glycosyltransferase family 9 protein [Burkholderiaceae bacterium]
MASVAPVRWTPKALAQACVQQPLTRPVPADDGPFRARKGLWKLAVRTGRRQLLLGLSGQLPLLRMRIDPAWRRLLWVHEGMPQIGDALMDLAPRSLLHERGLSVDLFAAPHIASLFAGDRWFTRVLSSDGDVQAQAYDAVIVLSHDRKALRLKRERLSALPWVSLQGYYGGPDFHRARFAARRVADLLGLTLSDAELAPHATQKLAVDAAASRWAAQHALARRTVAVALGGVRADRTYHRWVEVARLLQQRGIEQLLLLGGDNGRPLADELAAADGRPPMLDLVGRTDLRQAHALLSRASVAVCADGGLMHLAFAASIPVVSIFNAAIEPQWRLPPHASGASLASSTAVVDDLSPHAIADAVSTVLRAH